MMASKSFSAPKNHTYQVLGIMSGTSLDGLDLAYCVFKLKDGRYDFNIEQAATIPYPEYWQQKLAGLVNAGGLELTAAHSDLGKFIGQEAKKFITAHQLHPELIACHGHTIFHQPPKGFSLQIGDGYQIMVQSGCSVVNDFRSLDVAMGGQGAPLVPVGDELLFGDNDFCLNLGGIANISAREEGRRIAFDIGPANMVLNFLARRLGKNYDAAGAYAASGKLLPLLLEQLNQLDFYAQPAPKSLGYEWVSEQVFPLLEDKNVPAEDYLFTFCTHLAQQIRLSLTPFAKKKEQQLLITGGGAYNSFFIGLLEQELEMLNIRIVLPEDKVIEFKEALIFALLGVLRIRREANCLASVTGASHNSCGGTFYDFALTGL